MIEGGIDARPDKLGLMMYFQTNKFGSVVMVHEVWSGAIDEQAELIEGLRQISILILIPYGGKARKVVGPAEVMAGLQVMVDDAKARKVIQ